MPRWDIALLVTRSMAGKASLSAFIDAKPSRLALCKHVGQDGNNYNKGSVIAADCNVTGTDCGTPSKPKFPLKALWEHVLIPALEALVAPEGLCAGATVVHQEDNAGPHKEGNYHTWLKTEFESRGWKLELQAPHVWLDCAFPFS